jgi:hypothetical protein
MITANFYKAQPTGQQSIDDLTIVLDRELPEFRTTPGGSLNADLQEYQQSYMRDGKELAALLLKTLPGGTFDQLLCEMLKIKASHFKVSFGEVKE